MLRIRLRKAGKSVKRRYYFKIVVIESSKARDSRFTEKVGDYAPGRKTLQFDTDKYERWVKKGARPTDTVAALFKRYKKKTASQAKI